MSVSAVGAVNSTTAAASTAATAAKTKNDLGEDDFMQLLLAQLQNQDPLQPASDTEFIAQLAQFNSLAELTSIKTAISDLGESLSELMIVQDLNQGSALIGKTIGGMTASGETVSGVVASVQLSANQVYLKLEDNSLVPIEQLSSIEETPALES